ncbi:MAG: methionine--tRNA ligase [Waddliaceae bacterium]
MSKILITSALPYANGPLHFGHIAGAYLPGDCYARFCRLKGDDVLYLSGSDEYGVAITLSAEIAGRTPKAHVDIFHQMNKELFEQLNFSFDHYSRTTWDGHKEPVQRFFLDLLENGYIEEKITDQLYSETEKRFLADRYVIGVCPSCGFESARGDECPKCSASFEATDLIHPRSKLTNSPLVLKATKHWFLKLDMFKDRLLDWLKTKEWKPNVVNFVHEYIKKLRPRAITRDSEWGIPVPLPNTEGKVLYVWFDAPIGYISAAMEWSERWKEYWCDPETKLVHFIGKDNIPFHAVIFPAMTMGQKLPYKLVDELPANEFLMLEGRQFSKSDGWYIDFKEFFLNYSSDQIRYVIAANAPETQDSEFTWKDFQRRCNSELLGKLGNLVNRVMVFANRQCEGKVPACNLRPEDEKFRQEMDRIVCKIEADYRRFSLRRACHDIMELAQLGNTYFDNNTPWKKGETMPTTIALCLECIKRLALVTSPIIPETAQKIWEMIGENGQLEKLSWDTIRESTLTPGQSLREPQILFQKIEDSQIQTEIDKLKPKEKEKPMNHKEETMLENPEPLKDLIEYPDFDKLDFRVAKISHAEPVPKSKKLLKVTCDLGFETRQVVAGIQKNYTPEELIGKKVVLLANLKPAKLAGVESQGMLLCAGDGNSLEILEIETQPLGSVVS